MDKERRLPRLVDDSPRTHRQHSDPAVWGERLASVIRTLRRERRLSCEQWGDLAGLPPATIAAAERGERGLSVESLAALAHALDLRPSDLLRAAEDGAARISTPSPRTAGGSLANEAALQELTGLGCSWLEQAITSCYATLDLVDQKLAGSGSLPLARLVELANLSSMIGNLLGGALAAGSGGAYRRNKPHTFPDLVPRDAGQDGIEIKTALESNLPKGHNPKPGLHLTFRYVLGDRHGGYTPGKAHRGDTAWIWEVRVGQLGADDFRCSNTAGDSGKTATIQTASLQGMTRVYFRAPMFPYKRRSGAWFTG